MAAGWSGGLERGYFNQTVRPCARTSEGAVREEQRERVGEKEKESEIKRVVGMERESESGGEDEGYGITLGRCETEREGGREKGEEK